jgi:hypothetical protein
MIWRRRLRTTRKIVLKLSPYKCMHMGMGTTARTVYEEDERRLAEEKRRVLSQLPAK